MKKFLATTAIAMTLAAPAFAESHAAKPADSTMSTDTANMEVVAIGTVVAQPTDLFASDLIGMRIYNVEQDMDATMEVADGAEVDWDDIGEINDIIVTANGQVSAVILGIGGFIGIGERDVSVPMSAISIVQEAGESDDFFLVVKSSKEELEAAPAFERSDM